MSLSSAGCGPKAPEAEIKSETSSPEGKPSGEARMVDAALAATLKGRVFFEGEAPKSSSISVRGNPECAVLHPNGQIPSEEILVADGNLQNVFVYIKEGLEGYAFETPAEPVTIDNKNCVYLPHVTGARVNQPVVFLNSDSTLHNIHAFPKNSKPFNLGLPFSGMKQTKKFTASEVMVSLKCDVHPWMLGYVGVLEHPYFSVTKSHGTFELPNLPPGDYEVEAWHEKLGAQSQTVTIGPRETKEIEFRFKAA